MKKTIGLGLLLLTGMTAFAAPRAAYECFGGNARTEAVRTENVRKEAVVVRHDNRTPAYRDPHIKYDRTRR